MRWRTVLVGASALCMGAGATVAAVSIGGPASARAARVRPAVTDLLRQEGALPQLTDSKTHVNVSAGGDPVDRADQDCNLYAADIGSGFNGSTIESTVRVFRTDSTTLMSPSCTLASSACFTAGHFAATTT